MIKIDFQLHELYHDEVYHLHLITMVMYKVDVQHELMQQLLLLPVDLVVLSQ